MNYLPFPSKQPSDGMIRPRQGSINWINSSNSPPGGGDEGAAPYVDVDVGPASVQMKPTIILDPRQERDAYYLELASKLASTGHVFDYNGLVCVDVAGRFRPVTKPTVLSGDVGSLLNVVRVGYPQRVEYVNLPPADATYAMASALVKQLLPKVHHFTRIPVLNDHNEIVRPGYNPCAGGGIYYEGDRVVPSRDRKALETLLSVLRFKREADRTGYLAFLLTPFLGPRFPGGRPMLMIRANQRGAGKTTAAQIIVILSSPSGEVVSVTWERTDWAFEKKLGSAVRRGHNVILVDNIAAPAKTIITSASLERTITAKEFSFRHGRTDEQVQGANHLVLIGTFNHGTLGPDLCSRSVFSELCYLGDIANMRVPDETGPLLPYARDYRQPMIAGLLGMLEVWREQGCPLIPVDCRFAEWAAMLNGILRTNGRRDFLATYKMDRNQADEWLMAFAELASERPGQPLSASAWRREAERLGLFPSLLEGRSERGKDTIMGDLLKSQIGIEVWPRSGDEQFTGYKLESSDGRNGKLYLFTPLPG